MIIILGYLLYIVNLCIDESPETNMVAHAYDLHSWEVGEEGLEVQSHPQLHSELEAKLEYISSYLKKRIKKITESIIKKHLIKSC